MKLKLDLHVHTLRSGDAFTKPEEIAPIFRALGLDGLAITDHDQLPPDLPEGLKVIPGVEVSSGQGHVIGLGVRTPVRKGLSAEATIQEIRKQGGVAIIPHPYDLIRPSVKPDLLTIAPDAVEAVNSSSFFHTITWNRAKEFARREGLPTVGGSDSHIPQTLGRAFTLVETDSADVESILDAIKTGSVSPAGRPIKMMERCRKLLLHKTRPH